MTDETETTNIQTNPEPAEQGIPEPAKVAPVEAKVKASAPKVEEIPRPSIWDIYYPKKLDKRQDVIYVASFPQIVLFWPTVVTLFLGAILQIAGVNPVTMGWILVGVVFLNFLPLVQDFDQKKFIILLLSVFTFILAVWIMSLYGFSFFQTLGRWFLSFEPKLETDAYLVLGSVLLFLMGWGFLGPLFSYWKFEQNEFVHYTMPMGKDMSIARMGCTIYKDVPDVLEYLITFGGGSLVIRRDNQVLATIDNVPFLGKRMEAIEEMLSETRVVIDQS